MSPAACIELIAASHAEDAAPLAPRARPPEMAPRRSLAGPAAAFGRDPRARASACPGEPALGLSPDLRRGGEARPAGLADECPPAARADRKSTRLNSSHGSISYAV